MTIGDVDLFDLLVWVAWEKRMLALPPDPRGNRHRRGLWTAGLIGLFGLLGYVYAATLGCLLATSVATMYAIENYWSGAMEEFVSVPEFLLYSDEFKETNKKELTDQVRDLACKYESKDYATLARLVASHPSLRHKIAEILDNYLLNSVCFEVAYDPDRRR